MPKQRKKARDSTAKARDSTATTTPTRRSTPKRANSSPNQPLTVQNDVLSLTTQNEAQRVPSANEIASSIISQLRGATDVGQLPASTSLQEVINLVPGPTANIPSSSTVAAENPEFLGIDNSPLGDATTYLLNNSLPLGFNVSEKARRDIWADNYVDLTHLLPNFNDQHEDEILFKSQTVKISTNVKSKQFFSIYQWTAAFDIFMSLFIVKSPESSLGLIKYAYNIRAMSKQFGFPMAKSYDENFRKVRKMMRFDWAIIYDELWRSAFYQNVNATPNPGGIPQKTNKLNSISPFQKRAQQYQNQFPSGYCWAYCRTGACQNLSDCKLKHQCVKCGKGHATYTCRGWQRNKATYTNKSR